MASIAVSELPPRDATEAAASQPHVVPGAGGASERSPLLLSAGGKAAESIPLVLLFTLVPRALGPGGYGLVALAMSVVTIGSASTSLGGPVLLSRFVPTATPARRASVARALARRLARWRALQVLGFAAAAAVVSTLDPHRFPPLVTLAVVAALCFDVAATLCFQVALALGHVTAWTLRYALQNGLLVVAVLVLDAGAGPRAAIAGVTIASGGALLLGAAIVASPLAGASRAADVPGGALRFGVAQGLAGFLLQVLHRGGVVAVALIAASSRQTGFAALATGVALAATFAIWQAFAIQLPRLAAKAAADPSGAEAAAERLAWTSLLVVAPAALVASLVLRPALPLLAGAHFRDARAALGPALAVIPLAPLSALVNQVAALRLRAGLRAWSTGVGAAVFVAVAATTVPSIGAAGATTALLAGTLAAALAGVVLLRGAASRRVLVGSVGTSASTMALALLLRSPGSLAAAGRGLGFLVAGLLAVLALRRIVLLGAALLPVRAALEAPGPLPSLTLLVAAHAEAGSVGRLLRAVDRLDYPRAALTAVVVDDGSDDETGEVLARWARGRPWATSLRLEQRCGKSGALNAALGLGTGSELVTVFDADQEPQPDSLRHLVAAFADPAVGAAGAYLRPVNAEAGFVARYAAVEAWVTQLVTSAARSRLDLNPPMLGGGSTYRRAALEEIGGFPDGFSAEDVSAAIALTRHGWRTRFVRRAVVDNLVVDEWRTYWHQHVRWARSGYESARLQSGPAPLGRRIEGWMVSAGYADRLALLAAFGLAAIGALPVLVPLLYLGVVGLDVVAAVARGGAIRRLPLYLLATFAVVGLDAAGTVAATVAQLRRRPLEWRSARVAAGV